MFVALSASVTLGLDGLVALLMALAYAYVGRMMARRPARSAADRRALRSFGLWWRALALLMAVGGLQSLLVASGVTSMAVFAPLAFLGLAPLAAALGGLVYYLLYVWTGRESLLWPVALGHGAILVFFVGLVWWLDPVSVRAEAWQGRVVYARELEGPVAGAALALLLGPALFAAAAYGSLAFRTRDRTVRYRVALVSGAFLLWFGAAALGAVLEAREWAWWPLASRLIGLLATLMVIAAYRPPGWLRARWGLDHLEEGGPTDFVRPPTWRPQARALGGAPERAR